MAAPTGQPSPQTEQQVQRADVEASRLYRAQVAAESFLQELTARAPGLGLWDGLDPALPDHLYRPDMAPDLENIRVGGGLWQTRLGMALWTTLGGSGQTWYLNNYYRNNGTAYRVAMRGGTFYYATSNGSFGAASGGTGIAQNVLHGLDLYNVHYFLDQSAALRRFNPSPSSGNQVVSVTQPAAPTHFPTAKRATWDWLEDFLGTVGTRPTGWTASASTKFDGVVSAVDDAGFPSDGGQTLTLTFKNSTGVKGSTFGRNIPGQRVRSHTILFFFEQSSTPTRISFDVGINAAADFPNPITPPTSDETSLKVVPVGDIPTLNYVQFRVTKRPSADQTLIVSRVYLPGRLQGLYRWVMTNYSPTTGAESAPSGQSNSGVPLDLSIIGTDYQLSSKDAIYKSAQLRLYPDNATTKRRVYRNGGSAPGLYKDTRNQDVWLLAATVPNLSTTLNGSVSAAAPPGTAIVLTAIGNSGGDLASGDCILLDPGVVGKEEYVSIDDFLYYDLAVDASNNLKVTSATRPFVAADVGNTLTVTGSSSASVWTAGTYVIASVSAGAAILASSPAATSSTGGLGTLAAVNSSTKAVLIRLPLVYAHANGATAEVAFWDNVSDTSIDPTQRIDLNRDDCPTGAKFITKTSDGRLWVANWPNRPMGIALSNKPTPYRPNDHEVFPQGIDPLTTQNPIQGFDFDLNGDSSGDAIVWLGVYQGIVTALTSKALYRVFANSQVEFSALSVRKILDTGCIAGETVQDLDGLLYWVAEGPSVVRWDGRGLPQDLSFRRCSQTLLAAPADYWGTWFARTRRDPEGSYYYLWMDPELLQAYTDLVIDGSNAAVLTSAARPFVATDVGRVLTVTGGTGFTAGTYTVLSVTSGAATFDRAIGTLSSTGGTGDLHAGCAKRLDYAAVFDAWEPSVYADANGNAIAWQTGVVRNGPGDHRQIYQAHPTAGTIYQFEDTGLDAGNPVRVRWSTKKYSLPHVCKLMAFYARGEGFADLLTVNLRTAGSEYKVPAGQPAAAVVFADETAGADLEQSYALDLSGTGDVERHQRVDDSWLRGHWAQFLVFGSVTDQMNLRELELRYIMLRDGRLEGA